MKIDTLYKKLESEQYSSSKRNKLIFHLICKTAIKYPEGTLDELKNRLKEVSDDEFNNSINSLKNIMLELLPQHVITKETPYRLNYHMKNVYNLIY